MTFYDDMATYHCAAQLVWATAVVHIEALHKPATSIKHAAMFVGIKYSMEIGLRLQNM